MIFKSQPKCAIFWVIFLAVLPGISSGWDIIGTVTDSSTGQPVPNAVVIIWETGDSSTTDINGEYSFMNVDGGYYTILIGQDSYQPRVLANTLVGEPTFVCGDVNCSRSINLLDITYLIAYLYKGGPQPCILGISDVNNSGSVNLLDITYLIAYLYKGGPAPNCP